ncbi:substrate-binding domain-containing protein [Kitasatospora sp. NPDC059673]|uniref:substrate-binding domain-containing protein n=1 Tax=Kitasatospora sp. NPDC059673 TaxID=3346901 RepID=UPI0036B7B2BA
MRHTAAKALAAVAFTAALTTVATVPAMADPAALPAAKDIVGAGSDTTQALFSQFSTDYNATLPATDTTTPRLYSWDATGSPTIVPKAGGNSIPRPNGSSAGINTLNTTNNLTLDFARSSRAAQPTDPANFDFVAFAKDAVTWSAPTGGLAPANLTTLNLVDIYTCVKTDWSQLGGGSGAIKPYLPQSGSGTRSFFLQAIGNITPGTCVTSGPEENEGTDSRLTDPGAIFPYSVGHYVGQLNGHTSSTDNRGNLTLRSVNGVAPLTSTNTLSPVFAGGSYGRVLFNVLRDGDYTATTTQGTALRAIFSPTGWICGATGRADIISYGFLPLPGAGCGAIIH